MYCHAITIKFPKVSAAEGHELSRRHDVFAFHEVSVADQPAHTLDAMNAMIGEIWREKVRERKKERERERERGK
jgi:hypothetical protein